MGDTLGGRPKDTSCYNEKGRADYSVISTKPFFREGIERLKTAYAKNIPLAMMCSESKPMECHRTHLIANTLMNEGIDVMHIDEKGELKGHRLLADGKGRLFE
jgi:uncharacterized protein (DUF488 family)